MPVDSLTIVNNGQNVRVPINTNIWTNKVDSLQHIAAPLMSEINKKSEISVGSCLVDGVDTEIF